MKDIKNLITQMTLQEKASLCSGLNFWHLKGINRLNIPSIMVTDGPHGLRKQTEGSEGVGLIDSVPATCFPTASALAATWNRELVYKVGQALGEECLEEKVGVILGPGANIKRSPLCGRNFEYFSEDPYLTGQMAKSHINGVQSKGIGTSLKHYTVNNQEFRRMVIDAIIDERALREIYLSGYEIAVKEAQPWTVMCAYNKVNSTYCCENKYLMRDILKNEWGHKGLVVTDWGAMNNRVEGLIAGVELEMPGTASGNDDKLVAAVQAKQLDESILDEAVERILTLIFKAEETLSQNYTYNREAHHTLAQQVAQEATVLLKNKNNILPLAKEHKIALLGQFAKNPRYQGAGSSQINPTRLDNLYDELVKLVGNDVINYAPGYDEKSDVANETLLKEAVEVAKQAEIVIICCGLTGRYEVEGLDRTTMKMPPAHNALIEAIAAVHSNIVVVLSNGSPIEMPWAHNVNAILEGYLGGQASAGAIANILYGQVNPSGKLAETFPIKLEDNPSYHYFPGGPTTVEYRESIYVGYRYFDTANQEVLYPFGHGLSYTTFEYSNLKLNKQQISDTDNLTVTLNIKNTGSVQGKETIQLYVKDIESSIFRPEKELKGFVKVELAPNEIASVTLQLDKRAFAYYNPTLKDWHIESGAYEILVGASSRDIRLSETVHIQSSQAALPVPNRDKLEPYYNLPKDGLISENHFETLLGSPLPSNKPTPKGQYTINTPMCDMRDSFIGKQLYNFMQKQINKLVAADKDSPSTMLLQAVAHEAPLRLMLMTGDGAVTRKMLDALVIMINGKIFKGAIALIKAIKNK